MPQTSIAPSNVGVPGQLADSTRMKDCVSYLSEEVSAGIPFGAFVAQGSADAGAILPTSVASLLVGVTAHGHSYARPSDLDTDGVQPGGQLTVLHRGRIRVAPEDLVTPASEVHVRMAAGQGGAALVVADFVFTAEADTEVFTATAHGLLTGDGPLRVANSGGALPTGIAAATDYWVIRIDADNFYLATTRALALAGTHLSITTDGTGTQTASDTASTERVVTAAAGGVRGTPDGSPLVVADTVFTAANATEIFTATAHGLLTGDGPVQVSNSGGGLPAGLVAATDYWVIKINANTFYLATSRANAIAGTHLLITTDGTGTQTLADTVYTERLNTMDASKFARWKTSNAAYGDTAVLAIDMTMAAMIAAS